MFPLIQQRPTYSGSTLRMPKVGTRIPIESLWKAGDLL